MLYEVITLGTSRGAVYLIRPDQHVAARWSSYAHWTHIDEATLRAALRKACGKE